jgi:hypothetical protein
MGNLEKSFTERTSKEQEVQSLGDKTKAPGFWAKVIEEAVDK